MNDDLGWRMVRLGAHPRLVAMMLAARDPAETALAADLAALLEERDPCRGPTVDADVYTRLAAIAGRAVGDVDRAALSRIRQAAGQFRRRLGVEAAPAGDAGLLLAAAFPDRLAQRRGEPGSFRLYGGGGARLANLDPLASAGLLAVASLEQKASAQIRLAAVLDPGDLPPSVAGRVRETLESGFDPATGVVFLRRRRRYGALVLEDRIVAADPAETAATLARVCGDALHLLPWDGAARQLQARARLVRSVDPNFPDLSDEILTRDVQEWLAWSAELGGGCSAGSGVAGTFGFVRRPRDGRLYRAGAGGLGAGADVFRPARNAQARWRSGGFAGVVAFTCRTSSGNHWRPRRVLAWCMSGCAPRNARALPETCLAGEPVRLTLS